MFDVFTPVFSEGLDLRWYLVCTAIAVLCGIIAAAASSFREDVTRSFVISLIVLPAIVETVILMVNGNLGTGVAVMGAFSLVRFRSVPGKAKEIAAIFLSMTAGLACAAGYIWIALIFTLIVCAIIVLVGVLPSKAERALELRITVPESLNFEDAFDDVFDKYLKARRLLTVKSSNMGSLYKLRYRVTPKNGMKTRELIDDLRCRNGNLEISIGVAADTVETL